MEKLTPSTKTTLFIEKARKVHGDKYDYSKVEYMNSKTKVDIICIKHGAFSKRPNDHNRGQGCPMCGYLRSAKKQSLTISDFISRAKSVHGEKYDYSGIEYINNATKVNIECPIHGKFSQRPSNHLKGVGCRRCKKVTRTDDFIKKAKEIHGEKYDYSIAKFISSTENILIKCTKHGVFEQTPSSHLSGRGCVRCGRISASLSRTISTNEFIHKSKNTHGNKYDYSETNYLNAKSKVKIICRDHGVFYQTPNGHLQGKGCRKCGLAVSGWNLSNWSNSNKSKNFHGFICYLIVCYDNRESFLKVGRTSQGIRLRFSGKTAMPYSYTLISKVKGDAKQIYNLEKEVFRIPSLKRYQPKKEFGGQYECVDISELDRLKKWFKKKKKAKGANYVKSDIIKGQLSLPFGWD